MLPHRVSNPGPLTYESGALTIALRGPATPVQRCLSFQTVGIDSAAVYPLCLSCSFFLLF